MPTRRHFLQNSATAGAALFASTASRADQAAAAEPAPGYPETRPIFKSIKFGMFQEDISLLEKFRILKELGFDGVELESPGGPDKGEALAASRVTRLPIHGVVDSIHWNIRLSDPDPAVREKGLKGLLTAISDTRLIGGSAVLLVPGKVSDPANENQEQIWERSIEQIRLALPAAAQFGIHILIENVWNGFCYQHDGPPDQSAGQLADYLDAIGSPWVGSYFDIGNHQKYGKPADWIRTLGRRIVKLDVKDWGVENGFCKIGEGDVDWPEVRKALRETGFTGWSTAEVAGGDRERIAEVGRRMDTFLLGR